jgi:hypothetical protein
MFDHDVIRRIFKLRVGSESEVVVLELRGGVDPTALVAAERPLFLITGDDVLAELGTDGLQPVAQMTDDR